MYRLRGDTRHCPGGRGRPRPPVGGGDSRICARVGEAGAWWPWRRGAATTGGRWGGGRGHRARSPTDSWPDHEGSDTQTGVGNTENKGCKNEDRLRRWDGCARRRACPSPPALRRSTTVRRRAFGGGRPNAPFARSADGARRLSYAHGASTSTCTGRSVSRGAHRGGGASRWSGEEGGRGGRAACRRGCSARPCRPLLSGIRCARSPPPPTPPPPPPPPPISVRWCRQ